MTQGYVLQHAYCKCPRIDRGYQQIIYQPFTPAAFKLVAVIPWKWYDKAPVDKRGLCVFLNDLFFVSELLNVFLSFT